MQLEKAVPVQWIAEFIGAKLIGDTAQMATGINEIHKVVKGDISFVDFEKYYNTCLHSAATVIIINKEVDCPEGKTLLIHSEPFDAYIKLVNHFRPFEPANKMISDSAVIGEGTHLQPNVFVGNHVTIGKNCLVHSGVNIYDHTVIGDNVVIHSGTTIGSDAFYFKRRKNREVQYEKMISCGRVVIESDVEIGANCSIDKGVSGDTIIGRGTKLDNLVHIGHGVVLGKNCLIAGQVAIAGKTTIEDEVILWGQVGVNKDLTIGKGAIVYAISNGLLDIRTQNPEFIIECFPLDPSTTTLNENGLIIGIAEGLQKSPDAIANLKTSNSLIYAVAAQQANEHKWNDALILNTSGHIIESTIANIFWIKDNSIYTPPLSSGCIAGVMRRFIIATLADKGIGVQEKELSKEILLSADEVFLTNAIKGIKWVSDLENTKFSLPILTKQLYQQLQKP